MHRLWPRLVLVLQGTRLGALCKGRNRSAMRLVSGQMRCSIRHRARKGGTSTASFPKSNGPMTRTGCNGQRPLVGRFQCLRPRRFGQAHSAEAEAEALFWVDAVAQDHLDQRRDIWPDLPGPSLQPLRGPIWMTTVTGLNPGSPGDCCPNRRGHGGRRAPGCRLCRTWRERTHRSARS